MHQRQKETILERLSFARDNRDYAARYWLAYQDYLDPTDHFTSFVCEDLEGKQEYLALIKKLLDADENAKIFVKVYDFEEEDNEQFFHAETLIIFSRLSLPEIEQIFKEPEDIFPSDIGELTDSLEQNFIVGDDGSLIPAESLFGDGCFAYYCWWD